jgi:hypothetical protein
MLGRKKRYTVCWEYSFSRRLTLFLSLADFNTWGASILSRNDTRQTLRLICGPTESNIGPERHHRHQRGILSAAAPALDFVPAGSENWP